MFRGNFLKFIFFWGIVALTVSTVVSDIQHDRLSIKDENKFNYTEAQWKGEIKPRPSRSSTDDDEINYRLPSALKPTLYNLYLHPEMETGNFTGQETITVRVLEATDQIILHSNKLQITSVYVTNYEVDNFYLDEVREFLIINLTTPLTINTNIRLGIIFEGQMLNQIVGLYTSTYMTPGDEKRTIVTSTFAPTYARQAFPCFDEPNMKANFRITLIRPTDGGYHALSNMNEESSTFLGQYTEVTFAESVPMSTYLAVFVISDFAHNTKRVSVDGSEFDIRIFATTHQVDKTAFALDTAVAVTEFYIKNFKVEYPLPKLDMAAIPDFVFSAMENWGLVTYRETALLYDSSFSSTSNKQSIASVVAHELAHMWFGNLVTLNWWNDLWLNEGFASFMEFKAINEIYSDWGMLDQFLIDSLHGVMRYDSSVASHPIIQTVESPDEILELFDTISYQKGASVIRMLEDSCGIEKFEQAVTNYLTNFKYENAVTDDFLTEVENTGLDFDVKFMMRTWTEQMGLPVIEVKRTSATTFQITQKRFFSNIEDYDKIYDDSEFNYKWTIPLTYSYDHDSSLRRTWFNFDQDSVAITVPIQTKWVKFNNHQVGYYRVNYEDDMWHQIISSLVETPEKLAIADRAHLLNDVFSLADANQVSYEIALDMTTYLSKETDFVPWYVAAAKLQSLQTNLVFTDSYMDYLRYARSLISKVYEEVTWTVDEDNHLRNRLRVSILTAACSLGLPACLNEASTRFTAYLANPLNKPHPDLREIIYYYGMQHVGKQQAWEQMWNMFVTELDASEKNKLMYGLSGVKVPWLLRRYIDLAENEEYVRRQDYFNCMQYIASNPVGSPIVWEYVRENWLSLVKRFGLNDRSLGRLIPAITGNFATETKLEEITEFFGKHPEAGAGTAARQQALETVKYNINWLKTNLVEFNNWLTNHLN